MIFANDFDKIRITIDGTSDFWKSLDISPSK